MKLEEFDFFLPDELIAQTPVEPRDVSRLMLVDRREEKIKHCQFRQIEGISKTRGCPCLNKTKVIPARLLGEKEEPAQK
jgi:S-adenosylmethionine:tRNA ribosyltransferase-isomerase